MEYYPRKIEENMENGGGDTCYLGSQVAKRPFSSPQPIPFQIPEERNFGRRPSLSGNSSPFSRNKRFSHRGQGAKPGVQAGASEEPHQGLPRKDVFYFLRVKRFQGLMKFLSFEIGCLLNRRETAAATS
jgi:hypothetical protein